MERDPVDPHIEYDCVTDPSPSAAQGRFLGYEWDFYARWDSWCFALSTDPAIVPDAAEFRDLSKSDLPRGVFFREGKHGEPGSCSGSYMSNDEKQQTIRDCIRQFESTMKS